MAQPGIRLRLSWSSPTSGKQAIVDADSVHLYYIAKYGGYASVCSPRCLPGCQDHGWYQLYPEHDVELILGQHGLIVELKPVMLPDESPFWTRKTRGLRRLLTWLGKRIGA